MSDKKQYRVKVTEKHVGYVDIIADSQEEAKDLAMGEAECEFDCTYDCEIIGINEPGDTL